MFACVVSRLKSIILFQLPRLSLHPWFHPCVRKLAPIFAVLSQYVTNKTCLVCIKNKKCILGHPQTPRVHKVRRSWATYIKTHFSISSSLVHSVGSEQLCTWAHLVCACEVGTSCLVIRFYIVLFTNPLEENVHDCTKLTSFLTASLLTRFIKVLIVACRWYLRSWSHLLQNQQAIGDGLIFTNFLQEFFLTVKHILRTTPSHGVASFQKWTPAESAFNEQLIKCTENVHKALCGKSS